MKIKINRNILWTTLLTDLFVNAGIKYACISPGSRSTPLTFAIASEKKIKSFPIVDERASAFFALGIAKSSNSPVVIVTTSGTATAELYPAIIEAYQSRVPLIVCTADRPSYLRNTGTNQTINQKNIYKNHIRYFAELPLPSIERENIHALLSKTSEAILTATFRNKGPVHLNFQFEKPFEPDSTTDFIDDNLILYANKLSEKFLSQTKVQETISDKDFKLNSIDLITIGVGKFGSDFQKSLDEFSKKYNIPIFADANSGLRFSKKNLNNLISNYETLVRNKILSEKFRPKSVIHFGRHLTSQSLEEFIIRSKAKRFVINEFGDRFDSTKRAKIIKSEPEKFIELVLQSNINKASSETLDYLKSSDKKVEEFKHKIFRKSLNEVNIILELLENIPARSNLFIGNSLPVRDLDFFSSAIEKEINVFQNRGASGIDGVISSSLGIALESKQQTYLIIGDLSFYYDLNSLLIAKQYNIPLKIILINNNGGAIFNYLPIARQKEIFNKYFLTPVSFDVKKISESFGINFKLVKSLYEFKKSLLDANKTNSCLILEVRTDSLFTKSLKEKFWNSTNKILSRDN
uniref:2-succinyl-5-enolpyruvyl-6-hydroxy-3-cyclohexene-1-carboxylate synthase n=1 Tax=Ignavibacterium album TaxID=591197 RepID=A0A832DI15_9BACT